MKKILKHIILLAALALLPLTAVAGPTLLTAKLDSVTIIMGKTTVLRLELVRDKGQQGTFPVDQQDTLSAQVEIAAKPEPEVKDLGNGREQVNKALVVQAFDSGQWHINPITYITASGDTVKSGPLVLKVVPVQVNAQGDIRDLAPVVIPPRKFFDFVPSWITSLWWLWLLLLLAAAGVWAYFHWWRKGKNPFKPEKKRLPPYEEAMQRLQLLKSQELWQKGQDKDYYTALTDILREYIDRRFGINAVEMTTTQIVSALRQNKETQLVNDQLQEILAVADFVKFAGQRPLADDNERSFTRALQFVEATKPAPMPDDKGKNVPDGNNKDKQKEGKQ